MYAHFLNLKECEESKMIISGFPEPKKEPTERRKPLLGRWLDLYRKEEYCKLGLAQGAGPYARLFPKLVAYIDRLYSLPPIKAGGDCPADLFVLSVPLRVFTIISHYADGICFEGYNGCPGSNRYNNLHLTNLSIKKHIAAAGM